MNKHYILALVVLLISRTPAAQARGCTVGIGLYKLGPGYNRFHNHKPHRHPKSSKQDEPAVENPDDGNITFRPSKPE
jgi:hypothetical protein